MATPIPKNTATFTVAELVAATGGEVVAPGSVSRSVGVSTDTRELLPGAAFFALSGTHHDGHAHLAAAAAAGACVAVVERTVDPPRGMTVIRVPSTLRALGDAARAHLRSWRAATRRRVVGITGSAGKTTTRLATTALLEALYPGEIASTRGNLNNRVGLPMVLLGLHPEQRTVVVEMGTSEPGEIGELCRIAEPDVGVVTLIAAAHLEGLGSVDDVGTEKAALFRALPQDGVAIGNGDDDRVRLLLPQTPARTRCTYGRRGAAVRIQDRAPLGMTRSSVLLAHADGRESRFETPLLGEAGALACAAAVSVAEAAFSAQLDSELLSQAFGNVEVGAGAGRLVPRVLPSGLALIDDTYNANPASVVSSVRAATEIAAATGRRLVLVLGEMRELGAEAARGHEDVGRAAADSRAGLVFAIGNGEAPRIAVVAARGGVEALAFPSVSDSLPQITSAVQVSDLVLVKGSRALQTERVVQQLERSHGGGRSESA